ncbi:C10 family peptidase [Capnocytophaga sp. ARDL2]|uniref:C10 family peptidase n=1 Tax=Capnocytophaga sp. ARDL2 TaxID=3238809 RepID=UPI003556A267
MRRRSLLGFLLISLFSCQNEFSLDAKSSETENLETAVSTVVTIDQAKKSAVNFLNRKTNQAKGLPVFSVNEIEEVQTIENDRGVPIMYAINLANNKGFVVLSASIFEKPILAYSNFGKFDFENIEEYGGVVDWAYTKYLKIDNLITKNVRPNADVIAQWNVVNPELSIGIADSDGNIISLPPLSPIEIVNQEDVTETYGPHLTTAWGQSLSTTPGFSIIGYNNFVRFNNCPQGTAPTGCVATAVAQIMKYYNHPNIYEINNMPNVVTEQNYTTSEAHNVAYFMQDIGAKVSMSYSCTGSGAYSSDARNALVTHYSYNASNVMNLNTDDLVNDLINSKPVYLDGCGIRKIKTRPKKIGVFGWTIGKTTYSYENCHAWVADGYEAIYRTTTYNNGYTDTIKIASVINMNWGWNGQYNGWYDYENWNESNGDPSLNYIYQQHMINNINPR